MPRPKRSKIISASTTARPGAVSKKATPASKAVAEEIEDGSDEGKNKLISVRRLPRTNSKRKTVETRVGSTAIATEPTSVRKGRGKGKEIAEDSGDNEEEIAEDAQEEASLPSIEMFRREDTTLHVERSETRRGKQSTAATRKAPRRNEVVSSIESDLAVAPITLPRMENTILGQPNFRGRARQRAPSILGKGAGAARARSSSMGLEMTGALDAIEPGSIEPESIEPESIEPESIGPSTVQSTLPPMENTILAQPNFRGRARQRAPSILGKGAGAARARSSSMGVEMADAEGSSAPGTAQSTRFSALGGTFKRRERQPSILGSNRKKMLMQQEVEQGDQGGDSDDGLDEVLADFDDFNPEDESTPLRVQKTKSISAEIQSSAAAPAPTSSNSRKRRKISEIQVPRSPTPQQVEEDIYGVSSPVRPRPVEAETIRQSRSPLSEEDIYGVSSPVRPRTSDSQALQQPHRLAVEEDIYGVSSPAPSRPVGAQNVRESQSQSHSATPQPERPATEEAASPESVVTPEPLSETNAPPRSSSPSTPTFPRANLRSTQQQKPTTSRARKILTATQDSPISSPPSLTHSPNYKTATKAPTKKKAAKKAKAEAPLTTATLENLLPRRRRRRARQDRDEFDIASSEDEVDISNLQPDDDELSHLNAPARRARTRTPGISKGRSKTPATAKKPLRKTKPNTKGKRTYGSNKENQGSGAEDDSLEPDANETPEDENSQELEERVGKELKSMKRKFEVVDQWDLEFEDVDGEGNSSEDRRMADAR